MPTDLSMLNSTITALGARYEDLHKMSLKDLPDDDVSEVLDQMVLVNHDISQFEDLRNHLDAGQITVEAPTDDDVAAMKKALALLDEPIAADQNWSAAYTTVRSILDAANQIEGNVRKRQG
jgi:hypothetical protein